jgi:hypothetical protein
MNKIMDKIMMLFWGIMLFIGLMLTGSFIGVVITTENRVNIMTEENNFTDGDSPKFPLVFNSSSCSNGRNEYF